MANEFVARHGLIVLGDASASFFSGDGSNLINLQYDSLSGVPVGLVSSSAQVNSGSFTGSFTGSLLGGATTAVTAAYALSAGAAGDGISGGGTAGTIPVYTDVKVLGDSPLTATVSSLTSAVPVTASIFTGSFIGLATSASWALTSAYAENVNTEPPEMLVSAAFSASYVNDQLVLNSPLYVRNNTLFIGGTNSIQWGLAPDTVRGFVSMEADGVFRFGDSGGGGSPTIILGSNDANSVSLIRNGTSLVVRNGNNTAYGAVTASVFHAQGAGTTFVGTASWAMYTQTASISNAVNWTGIIDRPAGLVSSSAQTLDHIDGETITPMFVSASEIHVDGKVVATEFHTQFVSASIIYQSGSTKFGDTSDDVMSVTGTLHVSGTTVIEGPISFTEGLGTVVFGGSLYDTATEVVNIGTTAIALVPTASYDMAHFKYVIKSGSNSRTGDVMAVWNQANVEHTDTSTTDIGNTTNVVFDVDILGENARLKAVVSSTNDWTVKTIIQAI